MTVAALFVDPKGVYAEPGLDVDVWDETRDARLYDGPWPVVAHPPCARWSQLAGLVEATHGHKKGDDGGCFAAALAAVRTYGGVLEHPANTRAWKHFWLPIPKTTVGWTRSLTDGGGSTYVEQSQYGHVARKPTWLYYVGSPPVDLSWGRPEPTAIVSNCANHFVRDLPRVLGAEAAATPPAFRDVLLQIARTAHAEAAA